MGGANGRGQSLARDRGRRARALALFLALWGMLSAMIRCRPAPPPIASPCCGYRDRGIARLFADEAEFMAALADCPSAAGRASGQQIASGAAAFARARCPTREGHWPLPVSLLFGLPVDINALGAPDFEALPGIGPVLAQRIVAKREELRGFRALEDLRRVRGIGEKKYRLIEEALGKLPMGHPNAPQKRADGAETAMRRAQ